MLDRKHRNVRNKENKQSLGEEKSKLSRPLKSKELEQPTLQAGVTYSEHEERQRVCLFQSISSPKNLYLASFGQESKANMQWIQAE